MKIAKFAAMAKRAKHLDIIYFRDTGTTWMTNAYVFYQSMALPRIKHLEEAMAIFDISKKQAKDLKFSSAEFDSAGDIQGIDRHNYSEDEQEAEVLPVVVSFYDRPVKAVRAAGQVIFFDGGLLTPINDDIANDEGYIRYYLRRDEEGSPYIVVKNGTIAIAALMRVKLISEAFMKNLDEFHDLCRAQAEKELKPEQK